MLKFITLIIFFSVLLTWPAWLIIMSSLNSTLRLPGLGERLCIDLAGGEGLCILGYLLPAFLISLFFVSLATLSLLIIKKEQFYKKAATIIIVISALLLTLSILPYLKALMTYKNFISRCNKYSFPTKLREASVYNKRPMTQQFTFKINFDSMERKRVPYISENDTQGCVVVAKIKLSAYDTANTPVFRHNYKIGYRSSDDEEEIKTLFENIVNNYDLIGFKNILLIYPIYKNVARSWVGTKTHEPYAHIEEDESGFPAISLDGGKSWRKIDLLNSERFLSYDFYKGLVSTTIRRIEALSKEKIKINNRHHLTEEEFVFIKVGDVFKYSGEKTSE